MKLVTFKNTLPGILDLAPLRDDLGRTLVFRGNETRDLPAELLEDPIIQRVMGAQWLVEVKAPVAVIEKKAPPNKVKPIVIKTSAPPEELKLPVMPEEPASPSPAEAPPAPATTSEAPTSETPAAKR